MLYSNDGNTMPSRWKKLAIAGAILIIGIVTAWQFRRDETTEPTTVASAPNAVRQTAATSTTPMHAEREAKLAGRIEPYAGGAGAAERSSTAVAEAPPPTLAEQLSALRPTVEPPAQVGETIARYAPGNDKTSTPASSTAAPQSVAPPDPRTHGVGPAPVDRFAGVHTAATISPAPDKRHKIIDGDTLAAIAGRYLGAAERSQALFEYNRDVLATPELLPIGKELRIPPADFVAPAASLAEPEVRGLTKVAEVIVEPPSGARPAAGYSTPPQLSTANGAARMYVVQPHDTLALIARKLYGDIARQRELMAANRQQLRSPQDLRPGMTLFVPAAR